MCWWAYSEIGLENTGYQAYPLSAIYSYCEVIILWYVFTIQTPMLCVQHIQYTAVYVYIYIYIHIYVKYTSINIILTTVSTRFLLMSFTKYDQNYYPNTWSGLEYQSYHRDRIIILYLFFVSIKPDLL